jgi:hypothetical protein
MNTGVGDTGVRNSGNDAAGLLNAGTLVSGISNSGIDDSGAFNTGNQVSGFGRWRSRFHCRRREYS